MKLILCLTLISLLTSCVTSSKNQTAQEEVFFDDGYQKNTGEEVVFNDIVFADKNESNSSLKKIGSTPISKAGADGSRITYSSDSSGNQSESRCFNNHSRISCILLRTTVKGEKTGFVYAQNGEIKKLPANMFNDMMTASADELAGAAGVFEGKKELTLPTGIMRKAKNSQPLQPMPSYKFPMQSPTRTQVETTGQTRQSAEKSTENTLEAKDGKTQEQDGTDMQNRQSDKRNEK
jgi:hypothetical protein